ncbi:MAG TPA: glycoside hydrolase family 97 protein [Prolixibacteraceae bacterium]|nr:glycoside hydrolase family 97 protein [Prolixibacteraceae bacterium]
MKKEIKKRALLFLLALHFFCLNVEARKYEVASPDRKITVQVMVEESISYSVKYDNKMIVLPSEISMIIGNERVIGRNATATDSVRRSVQEMITPVVKEKRAQIPDIYNELVLRLDKDFELCLRAYDDGVAYRFGAAVKGELTVKDEKASFNFAPSSLIYYPQVTKRADADSYHTSFEETYTWASMDTLPESMLAFSPVLVSQQGLPKVLITESDLVDYPGMFLTKGTKGGLNGRFAPYPLKEIVSEGEFRQKLVSERASYIAKTRGTRAFPWRVIMIAPTDGDLLVNDLVYRLASAPDFTDTGWIKPGLSTEEWITNLNLYGVDFIAGLNTSTYKYYIDFASKYGFEYVMLDAGWSDNNDLFKTNPSMDMEEITRYAKEKEIGLILWTQALTIERQMPQAMEQFKKWGIKIVMTDFIDRDDQIAINFMHRFAAECARNKLMCMIHGAPKPAGFTRTWPNMLTREGVLGSEFNAWSARPTPEHDLLIPFIRMAAGPMDYEPGILQHASQKYPEKMGMERVIAQGTRMHQIAMFVVYESPLQLFSGNLSDAHREPELMTFLGKLPTVWDETRILKAELGKSVVEARRNGSEWVIAAMNDWTPLDFSFPADFLGEGEYVMEVAADGINAERNPHDYSLKNIKISAGQKVSIHLAPGGGYVARIYKK